MSEFCGSLDGTGCGCTEKPGHSGKHIAKDSKGNVLVEWPWGMKLVSSPVDLAAIRDLTNLRIAAEDAIKKVRQSCSNPEAINWASLHCTEASLVVTDQGERYLRVTIEEASPDASSFRQKVCEALAEAGWPDVQVETEW